MSAKPVKVMNAHDILVKVRDEILTDRSRWTKETSARDESGDAVYPESSKAVCWCLGGAVQAAAPRPIDLPGRNNARMALEYAAERDVLAFNDDFNTTFAMMREVLENAIERTRPA